MSLEDKIKKEKNYLKAASTFVASRAVDVTTTALIFSQDGNAYNLSPAVQYFVENQGLVAGLATHNLFFSGIVLGFCYYINKRTKTERANKYMYIAAGIGMLLSSYQFIQHYLT